MVKRIRELATGLMLISAVTAASGQDTNTGQQDKKVDDQQTGGKTTDEKQTGEKPETKAEAAKPGAELPSLTLGWTEWNLSGNRNKFLQYATPPDSFHLRQFLYEPWFDDQRFGGSLDLRAPGEDDYRLTGSAMLNYGTTRIAGTNYRNRFWEIDPTVIVPNERQVSEGSIKQMIGSDFALSFVTRMDQQDMRFAAPLDPLHQRTRLWNATAEGTLAGGFASLGYTDWRYFDRTDVLPDTQMQRWSVSYLHSLLPNLDVEGTFSHSQIKQSGLSRKNKIDSWSIAGDWAFGDTTTLLFDFRRDNLDLPNTQSAYVRDRSFFRTRLVHQMGLWSGQLAYTQREIERVRGDQSFVDVPKWHTLEARLYGRISPSIRFTARGVRETMDGKAGMTTVDPRALYWRNRWYGQVKLDASTEKMNAYFVYTLYQKNNDSRDVQVNNNNFTIGGSYQVKPELEIFAEHTTDAWSGHSGDPATPDLNAYLADGTAFTVGANYTLLPNAYITLTYNEFSTRNDNPLQLPNGNVRGRFLTTGLHYRLPAGYDIGVTFAPWNYRDKLYRSMGYDSALVTVSANVKF